MIIFFIVLISSFSSSQLYSMTKSELATSKKFCMQVTNLIEVMESVVCNLAQEPYQSHKIVDHYNLTLEKNIEKQRTICSKIQTAHRSQVGRTIMLFNKIIPMYRHNLEQMRLRGYLYHLDYAKGIRALNAIQQLALK